MTLAHTRERRRALHQALERLSRLNSEHHIELGQHHSIEEEALSEVAVAYTGEHLYLFPERLRLLTGTGETARELIAYLHQCRVVQRGSDGRPLTFVSFEVWVDPAPYAYCYLLSRECVVVPWKELKKLALSTRRQLKR